MNAKRIVVGGAIAAGKSTLIQSLPYQKHLELDPEDTLQKLLLNQIYQQDAIAQELFQLDMLTKRFKKWMIDFKQSVVFDRMIFEDLYFARHYLQHNLPLWTFYQKIWHLQIAEMQTANKMPDCYFLLACNWANFKARLFKRNRAAEIENFQQNQAFFQQMILDYVPFVTKILKQYHIPYFVLDTDHLTASEVSQKVLSILESEEAKTC